MDENNQKAKEKIKGIANDPKKLVIGIISIIVVIFLFNAIFNRTEKNPKKVVEIFHTAVMKDDMGKAEKYLDNQKGLNAEQILGRLRYQVEQVEEDVRGKDYKESDLLDFEVFEGKKTRYGTEYKCVYEAGTDRARCVTYLVADNNEDRRPEIEAYHF